MDDGCQGGICRFSNPDFGLFLALELFVPCFDSVFSRWKAAYVFKAGLFQIVWIRNFKLPPSSPRTLAKTAPDSPAKLPSSTFPFPVHEGSRFPAAISNRLPLESKTLSSSITLRMVSPVGTQCPPLVFVM